jgi:curved DNA-binding protein CbpA
MKRYASDPHQVLGIQRHASSDEVRVAYRNLAKRFHPDLNPKDPEAEERFKEVQGAYEEISAAKERLNVPPGFTGSHPVRGFAHHDEHPFFSFMEAVQAYYARKKDG